MSDYDFILCEQDFREAGEVAILNEGRIIKLSVKTQAGRVLRSMFVRGRD